MLAIYVLSAMAAAALLFSFGARAWYWHVIAGLAGLVIGLTPRPGAWDETIFYALTGSFCVFLLVWSLSALVVAILRIRSRAERARPRTIAAGRARAA